MNQDETVAGGRIRPQSLEAEQSVLGACMIEDFAVDKSAAILKPEDFYLEAHGVVFEAILALRKKGEPIDLLSVREQLTMMGVLENIGGASVLIRLQNAVPSAANVEYYARLVEAKSILRGIISAAQDIENQAFGEYENLDDLVAKMDSRMKAALRISSGKDTTKPIASVVAEAFERIEAKHELGGGLPGLDTGIFGLNYFLGGLEPQKMVVVGGRSSMGKSALGCTIIRNVLKTGKRVLAFSIEVDELSFTNRLLAIESQVYLRDIQRGTVPDSQWGQLEEAAAWLSSAPLTIDARPGVSPSYVRRKVMNAKRNGADLVVVDHMHIMQPDEKRGGENEASMWAQITRDLFEVGREFDLPMLVLAQFNREGEKRPDKRPVLSDFQGSGGIEQNAFTALGVYRPSYHKRKERGEDTPSEDEAEIYILKQRDGATGVIHCKFFPNIVKFVDDDPAGVPMKVRERPALPYAEEKDYAVIQSGSGSSTRTPVEEFYSGTYYNANTG